MTTPSIALALGAGGARGLAHIHALEALDELGIQPIQLSGTSMGSIMAAAYGSGMSGADIREFACRRFEMSTQLLSSLWRLRPDSVLDYLSADGPRIGELDTEKVMDVFLPADFPDNFSQLKIPTQVVATNYYDQSAQVFSTGLLKPALAASSSIPAIFRAQRLDGKIYVDGGLTNPLPFDILQADIIVAIDVADGSRGDPSVRPGKIDSLYTSSQTMQRSITEVMARAHRVDVLLRPDIGKYRVLDFVSAKKIIDYTTPFKDEVKRAITAAIDECS